MNEQQRATEREKYRRAYQIERYGMSDKRRIEALEAVQHWPAGSLLDVGCGRGEFLRDMEKLGFQAFGTETVPALCEPGNVTEAWGDELPFADDLFEYCTAWDVLEHTPPGTEVDMLREMGRVAKRALAFSANNLPSRNGNDNLHINIRAYDEWNRLVERTFPSSVVVYRPQCYSPIWVVEL